VSEIVTLHKNNNNNRLPSKLPAKELRRDVALPGPEADELTERDARQLAEVMEALDSAARCYSKRELPDAIDRAERFLGNGFGNRLAFAMSRANRDDLIVHLCSLVKSFPIRMPTKCSAACSTRTSPHWNRRAERWKPDAGGCAELISFLGSRSRMSATPWDWQSGRSSWPLDTFRSCRLALQLQGTSWPVRARLRSDKPVS
jgi:hypothetical protein